MLALLERVFQQTSDAMRAHGYGVQSGTTAVVCIVMKDILYVANVGDANAVLYTAGGAAERLTYEHKPSDPAERVRVEALDGGIVTSHRGGERIGVSSAHASIPSVRSGSFFVLLQRVCNP